MHHPLGANHQLGAFLLLFGERSPYDSLGLLLGQVKLLLQVVGGHHLNFIALNHFGLLLEA